MFENLCGNYAESAIYSTLSNSTLGKPSFNYYAPPERTNDTQTPHIYHTYHNKQTHNKHKTFMTNTPHTSHIHHTQVTHNNTYTHNLHLPHTLHTALAALILHTHLLHTFTMGTYTHYTHHIFTTLSP